MYSVPGCSSELALRGQGGERTVIAPYGWDITDESRKQVGLGKHTKEGKGREVSSRSIPTLKGWARRQPASGAEAQRDRGTRVQAELELATAEKSQESKTAPTFGSWGSEARKNRTQRRAMQRGGSLGLGWACATACSQDGAHRWLPAATGHTEGLPSPPQGSLKCSHVTCDSAGATGCHRHCTTFGWKKKNRPKRKPKRSELTFHPT